MNLIADEFETVVSTAGPGPAARAHALTRAACHAAQCTRAACASHAALRLP